MKTLHLLPLLGVLAIPSLLASRTTDVSLRFAPEADAVVEMEFSNTVELFLEEFAAEAMGQDLGAMAGDLDVSLELEIEVAFADTYSTTEDGQPMTFTREFDVAAILGEMSGSGAGGGGSESFELESGLDDSSVIFTWDEDDSEYTAAYPEDEEGDEDLLAGLDARVDLAFLLPEDEVSEGDEWEIDPVQLAALLLPGGDLGYDTPDGDRADVDDAADDLEEEVLEGLSSLMQGDVIGTFKRLDDDGLAEIAITVDIAGDRDFSDLVAEAIRAAADASGEDVSEEEIPNVDEFLIELSLDGEGALLWDPKMGVASSFSMNVEMEMTVSAEMSMSMPEMEMSMTGEVVLGGAAEITVEASY